MRQSHHFARPHPFGDNAGENIIFIIVSRTDKHIRNTHTGFFQQFFIRGVAVHEHHPVFQFIQHAFRLPFIRFDQPHVIAAPGSFFREQHTRNSGTGNHDSTVFDLFRRAGDPLNKAFHVVTATGNINFIVFPQNRIPVGNQELAAVKDCGNSNIVNDRSAGDVPQAHAKQLGGTADPDDRHTGICMTEKDLFQNSVVIKNFIDFPDRGFGRGKSFPDSEILRRDSIRFRNTV